MPIWVQITEHQKRFLITPGANSWLSHCSFLGSSFLPRQKNVPNQDVHIKQILRSSKTTNYENSLRFCMASMQCKASVTRIDSEAENLDTYASSLPQQ